MAAAEGIAADFQDALEDLRTSDEYAIANLVVIARENIQFAESIARVVVNHINKTRPDWKLPAMYVLDAISKRVGSPYTIYFQRNLFKTFMNAYSAMDTANRRAMDALLQTWKQPVPGTRDPTPVYPPHVTQEIERPLMQWRTTALQQQPPPARSTGPFVPQFAPGDPRAARFGRTPTPSNTGPPVPADRSSAPPQSYPNQNGQYGALLDRAQAFTQTPPPSQGQYQPPTPQYGQTPPSLPPPSASGTYQYNQQIIPQDNQQSYPPRPYSTPSVQSVTIPTQQPIQPPIAAAGVPPVVPPIDPEAAKALLAQILGNLVPQQTPTSVSTPPPPPVLTQTQPSNLPVYPPLNNFSSLLASPPTIRQAGSTIPLLGVRNSPTPAAPSSYPDLHNPATLKVPHPELIARLFQPDQCKQCGLRFAGSADGKATKQRHLDWHFHNNTRLAESTKAWKLTQRSWFVGEKPWIAMREEPWGAGGADAEGAPAALPAKARPEDHVVPVPVGAADARCPVCQERFESRWHQKLDTPVWIDAVDVKGLGVVHFSCWQEAYGKKTASQTGTPEPSVLGKRKFGV